MFPFEFSLPTQIKFGEGAVSSVGEKATQFGKKALLITYGEDFFTKVDFLEKVEKSCQDAGVELIKYFGVKSNPTVEHAQGAIEIAKKEKPDVLIALGGGSAMDEAKYVSMAALYDGDGWDFFEGKATPTETLPVIAVVTVPATSSELNGTTVMNYEKIQRKDGYANPILLPRVAILDPELTYTLPIRQTAYSAADIVSHLMEAYFGHELDWAPFQDRYSQGSIRTIMDCMDRLLKDPQDKQARAQMMWTASFAWNGFYPLGLGPADATIHVLGHSLSNFYDTPHGAAMSVTIPATMRYFMDTKTTKFAGYAREVFKLDEEDDRKAAEKGLELTLDWFDKISVPTTLKAAGITDPDAIAKMAPDAFKTAQAWGLEELYSVEKIEEMFNLCK